MGELGVPNSRECVWVGKVFFWSAKVKNYLTTGKVGLGELT